jgi:hypothetical protein
MSGSGRTPAGQFSDNVVNGITSSDVRPEGQERKHWPKENDAVYQWISHWRDLFRPSSNEWFILNNMLVDYRVRANNKEHLLEGN